MADQRTIVVVGGVAGGASAATRARRCNETARIILLEKDEHVSFANCGLPYYIGGEIAPRDKLLVATPKKFDEWFGIEVRTRTEAIRIDRAGRQLTVRHTQTGQTESIAYNKLILAPGASPLVPPFAKVDADNVFTLRNLADTDRIKAYIDQHKPAHATVIGAGFIGLEMIEMLVRLNIRTSLVELVEHVLAPMDAEMARILHEELKAHGVDLRLGCATERFNVQNGRAVSLDLACGEQLATEMVIVGVGVRPNVQLAQDAGIALGASGAIATDDWQRTSDPDIYAVGDAAEYPYGPTGQRTRIPLAGPANRAGRIAGEHAATDHSPPMGPVFGTAVVRVFSKTAGLTGLTEKAAARAGIPARAVWTPARHHAGYYPGAQEMMLKLVYAPDTGKVLGAQIVGGDGVDKRLDILATLMRFGGTVHELAELDLAYAPPFGSAKDPVHMAAFIAQNHLARLDDPAPPANTASLPAGAQVLDVRTPEEWQSGTLPGAITIQLHELRARIAELDAQRPVLAVCRGGQRGYYAARILRQHGFQDVRTLSGGMMMQSYIK